jgi:hypothetical protein
MNTFGEFIKVKKQETAQYFKKRFLEEVLDFYRPFKSLCHTSKLYNFAKITGPYWTITCTLKVQEMAGIGIFTL